MSEVILKSPRGGAIKPLIIAALEAEKNEILTAILKTKENLAAFEKKYNLSTNDFIKKITQEKLQISEMDAIEWSGEYETLKKLQERLSLLQEIQICT